MSTKTFHEIPDRLVYILRQLDNLSTYRPELADGREWIWGDSFTEEEMAWMVRVGLLLPPDERGRYPLGGQRS